MSNEIRNELKNGHRVIVKTYAKPNGAQYLWLNITREPSKSRFPKPELNYLYPTQEAAQLAENNFFAKVARIQEKRNENAQAKKEARKNLVNPYQVGQILWDSWGYEQTNIDFYQVVEVKPRSVVIRKIAQDIVESTGWASENVKPARNQFIGKPQLKVLTIRSSWTGGINNRSARVSGMMDWDAERDARGVHQSHYA